MRRDKLFKHIPITDTQRDSFLIDEARLKVKSNYLNELSVNNAPTNENPYNTELYREVLTNGIDKNLAMMNKKQIITKWENQPTNRFGDIALYDPRNKYGLDAQYHIGNTLPNQLKEMERNKIQTPYDYQSQILAIHQQNKNLGDGCVNNICNDFGVNENKCIGYYNPHLMTSNTNTPYAMVNIGNDSNAFIPDERLQRSSQTQQRSFKDENGRVNDAINILKSNEKIARERLQVESNNLINKQGALKQPRWSTTDMKFNEIDNCVSPSETDYLIHNRYTNPTQNIYINERQNKNANPVFIEKESFDSYNQRNTGNMKVFSPNKTIGEIDKRKYTELQKKTKYNNIKKDDKKQKHIYNDERKKNNPGKLIDDKKNKNIFTKYEPDWDCYSKDYKRLHQHEENILAKNPNNNNFSAHGYTQMNHNCIPKQYIDNEHILLARNGNVQYVYSDPNSEYKAPILLTNNYVNFKPIKTFVTGNKEFIYIIQKRDKDDINFVDGEKWNDDFLVVELPIKNLPADLRKTVTVNKSTYARDGRVLDLNYNDLYKLAKYVEENPNDGIRIKHHAVYNHLRGNRYDEEIACGYEPKKVLTTPLVINQSREFLRGKINDTRQRLEKEQIYNVNDNYIPNNWNSNVQRNPEIETKTTKQYQNPMNKRNNRFDNM